MDRSKWNDRKELKKFGIGLAAILAVVATVQWIRGNGLFPWFYTGAGVILASGLAVPKLLKPLFILFYHIGLVLGWFMTRLILTILYFFVITPIGRLTRLSGKKHLDTGFRDGSATYWIDRSESRDAGKSYEEQF
ncbi:hypothetical protein JW906_15045 [bacterium]|nr:hypothetical protein [bacterium]